MKPYRNTTKLPEEQHTDRLAHVAVKYVDMLWAELPWAPEGTDLGGPKDLAWRRTIAYTVMNILADELSLAFEDRSHQRMRNRMRTYRSYLHATVDPLQLDEDFWSPVGEDALIASTLAKIVAE